MIVIVCLAFQACAVSESPNNISSNKTKVSNGPNIEIGSSGSNKTEVSTGPNIEIRSSGSNKTKVSAGSNIEIGSNESNKTKVSAGPNIEIGSSGSNKTKVSGGQKTEMRSSGDYLNPNAISSGNYHNFPWYNSGGSFYLQGVQDTMFSQFREYYTTSGMPVIGGIISTPVKFDIAQRTPTRIYYGTGQALQYNQYLSTIASGTNDLWIQGSTNWAQYVVSPVGTWIQLVANSPIGGPGGFYEIVQTDTNTVKYNTYQFYQGYNTMNFNAGQVGRHMLYFVVNNQPSNVVIVDVFSQA
jgi:hypothetical protein